MRYIAIVSVAGLAMIAAGPLALQAANAARPDSVAWRVVEAKGAQIAQPFSVAPVRAFNLAAPGALAEQLGGAAPAAELRPAFAAAEESGAASGGGEGAKSGNDAAPATGSADTLAGRIRVALFADSRCPGEQQALSIIDATTAGWDVDTAGSALRIVGNDNDLCPAVGAALETVRDAASEAMERNAAPGGPTGGGAPGGGGGPGYQG